MELMPGYKETELGVIPDDWDVRSLSDVTLKIMVGVASAATHAYRSQGIPMFRNQNIEPNHLDDTDLLFISPEYEVQYINKRLRAGDLLTARTGYPGVTAVVPGKYDSAQSFTTLITRPDPKILDSSFLSRFINSNIGQRFFTQSQIGGAQKNVNAGTLRLMPVPLPNRREQRAIDTVLADVDALLNGLDRLIAKKRDIKQSVMQQLLTGKTRLPGFEGEWEVKRVDELGEVRSGGTPSTNKAEFWDGDLSWCTPTDITALKGRKYLSKTSRTISEHGLRASSAEVIPPKSLIMTSRATVGECAINQVAMTTNQGFKNIIPFEGTDVEFLYYLLTTQKCTLVALCGGSTFLEIGKAQLAGVELALPRSKEEQVAIATVLSDIDSEIEALEKLRAKTCDLKQAMMQELLTGRTRLV